MTIAFVNYTSATAGATGVLTISTPTDTAEGDILIASVVADIVGAVSSPNWDTVVTVNTDGDITTAMLYKVAGSSEPASYDFTMTGASYPSGVIMTFEKGAGDDDWDIATASSNTEISANTITTTSVTATDNSTLVCSFGNDDNESVTSAPADMTGYVAMSAGTTLAMYYEARSAGAITKSLTYGGGAEELSALALVLKAPSTGGSSILPKKLNAGLINNSLTRQRLIA